MSTRFLIVRHGTCAQTHETLLGRTVDAPLDVVGVHQVRALAARLRGEPVLRVEASPRLRTQQTARALAAVGGWPVSTAGALDEVDFGRWSGQSFAALEHDPDWQRWNRARGSSRTPAGEDMAGVRERAQRHLRQLSVRHPGATLLLVTHAEVLRALLLPALQLAFDDFQRLEVAPASVHRLCMDGMELHLDPADQRASA